MQTRIIYLLLILFVSEKLTYADNENLTLEIDNPRFTEKGLEEKTYEIKAKKGLQSNDHLELVEVEGKFKTEDGIWIFLTAGYGKFFRPDKIIKLSDDVLFYTDKDESIKSDFAIFEIDNGTLRFENNVEYKQNKNTVFSDRSIISDDFNHILYEGNVITKFDTKN